MSLKLTKNSEKILRQYHPGAGIYFISDGTGSGYIKAAINLTRKENTYYLSFGLSRSIKLTEEQIEIIGNFFPAQD